MFVLTEFDFSISKKTFLIDEFEWFQRYKWKQYPKTQTDIENS